MNDFDYENLEKKRLARNAKYQKKGSRSKKCTLPGDFLTNAEKAKLSTTVVDVNLKKKMRKEDFTKLSPEIQKEYLEWLRDEFGATSAMISKEMFGYSDAWLAIYTGKNAPHLKGLFPKSRRPKPTKSERARWLAFIGKPDLDDGKTIKPYREDEPEPVIEPHPTDENKHFKTYKPTPEPTPAPVDSVPIDSVPVDSADEMDAITLGTGELRAIVSDILSELLSDYTIEIRIKRGGTTA